MTKSSFNPNFLVPVALTALVSLIVGHSIDLGVEVLGSGPSSMPAIVGDLAALICCGVSAFFGSRFLARSKSC